MKKFNYFYFFCSLLFFTMLSSALSPKVACWLNGSRHDGMNVWGYNPLYYAYDYEFLGGSHVYGTHDWIAESALQLLYEQCSNAPGYGNFIRSLYTVRRYWYLLGSEIPDSSPGQFYSDGTFKSKYVVSLKTSCDNWVQNDIFTGDHGVLFRIGDPLAISHFGLLNDLNNAVEFAKLGLLAKDGDWAAYYLGAVSHLIADAGYYPHMLRGWDGWEDSRRDAGFRFYVNRLTNKKYLIRGAFPFFDIYDARLSFHQDDLEFPATALYKASVDCRYGNFYEGFSWINDPNLMDAPALHNIFTSLDSPWPPSYNEVETWNLFKRIELAQNPQWALYFDTIEHTLNTAVYYTACAINYMLATFYIGDDCSGEVGEDGIMEHVKQQDPDWMKDGKAIPVWLGQYEMAKIITIYGLLISLVAIVVVSKIDLIFPVIVI